jgi:hypothetical protein
MIRFKPKLLYDVVAPLRAVLDAMCPNYEGREDIALIDQIMANKLERTLNRPSTYIVNDRLVGRIKSCIRTALKYQDRFAARLSKTHFPKAN